MSARAARGFDKLFGVNFADGRIKGYDLFMPGGGLEKTFFVLCVRGNPSYGKNDFHDNGDGTITDRATGLMWSKADSGKGMNWQDALAWVQQKNAEKYLGHDDWRLPKREGTAEHRGLHAFAGHDAIRRPLIPSSTARRSPTKPARPTIRSTGQRRRTPDSWAAAPRCMSPSAARRVGCRREAWRADPRSARRFRRGPGPGGPPGAGPQGSDAGDYHYVDVHGAGAQRSDPKAGDPAMFPHGRGPQGDVIRIYNYVRLVRDGGVVSRAERAL